MDQGAGALMQVFVKLFWWGIYLFIVGPVVLWPRAIWRRLYPFLKAHGRQGAMWVPFVLYGVVLVFDHHFRRPVAHDPLGLSAKLQLLWGEFSATLNAPMRALESHIRAMKPGPSSVLLLEAMLATTGFLVSTIFMGPLHMLGLVLFPGGQKEHSHGSALWGRSKEAVDNGKLVQRGYVGGLMLGRLQEKVARKQDPRLRVWRHVLTCAPTGAGKGIGCVIPNLLEYPGSVVCLDVKGENFAVTARARADRGQAVFCLDPFGVTGAQSHRLNWLDAIDFKSEECIADAASLADTLVVRQGHGDSHWDDAAANFLQGVILYVAGQRPEIRHMGEVRRILTLPESELLPFLEGEVWNELFAHGVMSRCFNAFLGKADRERSGVLSTALRHTAFLDDPRIVRALSTTEICFDNLKHKAMTVYVVLPPDKLTAYNRFARATLGWAIKAMLRQRGRPQFDVLFLLDEFAQLGHFAAVEDAISILRGYGGCFWLLVQDLSQLRAVYPKAETFLSNSVLQAFGTQDYQTARYLSDMLGKETIRVQTGSTSHSSSFNGGGSSTTESYGYHGRELLTPDEIRRMPSSNVIALEQGEPPHLLRRLNYLTDPESPGQAQDNPMHSPMARAG